MILLASYLIVFGLGLYLGRRHLRPTESYNVRRLIEGGILGWLIGRHKRSTP